MYKVLAHFHYKQLNENSLSALNYLIEQWRYNGQIIGREIAITQSTQSENLHQFTAHLVTPEADSLTLKWNSNEVTEALVTLEKNFIEFNAFEIVGLDLNSEMSDTEDKPRFQILYTTYIDTCSPLYNGDNFQPIPFYKQTLPHSLCQRILKWQENWQACDQLQMNGHILENEALFQISEHHSQLAEIGRQLCSEIEQFTGIPTYYYLYRLGKDEETERQRKCPITGNDWLLDEPLHNIFHFKCEQSRLISNLSWEVH